MSLVDDSIREANAKHIVECQGTFLEHLAELERKRIANEKAMQDPPILAAFKVRRREQASQFRTVLQRVLLGRAQQ
jgi:hypothetical protein